jgi:prevent-host-death family protein
VKQLSATEASRRFSEVLDEVDRSGETYVVVRHGRAVATIGPAKGGTGSALKEALRGTKPDGAWAEELKRLRESIEPAADPWEG